MHYRREIDGLRAVAVLPVVFFHADFELFSGGFVGVDVFFVISGYLISSIILKEQVEGTFTILNFYERRARRILPALFFVMLCCIPFSWMWMYPSEFKDFGQSLLATSLFGSNILFWTEAGYFGAAAELKPLLHTWSLAVEEQYYAIFPLFILATWSLGRKWMLSILIVVAISSFAGAEWASTHYPAANFYLLTTRIWELLIGVFAAFYLENKAAGYQPLGRVAGNILSAIGIALIGIAVFTFDQHTAFPGFWALLPTIGTLFVILFAVNTTLVGRLLSLKPFVGIGLISYSLYLWHWPLFVFARLKYGGAPPEYIYITLAMAALLLAYFSWKYIEGIFRNRKGPLTQNRIFSLSLVSIIFCISIGLLIHNKDGFVSEFVGRYEGDKKRQAVLIIQHWGSEFVGAMNDDGKCKFSSRDFDDKFIKRFQDCKDKGDKVILIIGDSHAMNLYNIIFISQPSSVIIGLNRGDCRVHSVDGCHYKAVYQFIFENRQFIDRVIYHQSGSYFIADSNGNVDSDLAFKATSPFFIRQDNIIEVIDYLDELGNIVPVTWVGPFVELRENAKNFLFRESEAAINDISLQRFRLLEESLINLTAKQSSFEYVPFDDLYKIEKNFVFTDDCLTFRDKDHFSKCGEKIIAENISARPGI